MIDGVVVRMVIDGVIVIEGVVERIMKGRGPKPRPWP
jgi:hypothetical protein